MNAAKITIDTANATDLAASIPMNVASLTTDSIKIAMIKSVTIQMIGKPIEAQSMTLPEPIR
jgi:hypothetical protein